MSQTQEKPKVRLVPPITQKLLRENAEFQEQIRRGLNPAQTHPELRRRARALVQAQELRTVLLGLFAERRSALKADDGAAVEALEDQIGQLTDRLGRLFVEAGEFELALRTTRSSELRAKCRSLLAAIDIDDEEFCEHPKYVSHDGQLHPNYYRERDVWSQKHGQVVSVVRCAVCGFRNVRPLPADLAEMARMRAEALSKK